MAYEEKVRVVWSDVDAMNHVNNARYFTWMETVRIRYYFEKRKLARIEDTDFIVARACCDYRRGARLDEELVVRVWPTRVGKTSFTLRYRISSGAEVVADGETVQVCFDYSTQQKKSVPAELRLALEADLEAT